jgi:uncharacterized membrane protein
VLEFSQPTEIYFPDKCIICFNKADDKIHRAYYGRFLPNTNYKYDYKLELPVCHSCKAKLEMKRGLQSKSGKILCFSLILGLISFMILTFTFYSPIFGLALLFVLFAFPYLAHHLKMKNHIKLDEHIGINFFPGEKNVLKFVFTNARFAKELESINLKVLEQKIITQPEPEIITTQLEPETIKELPIEAQAEKKYIICPSCLSSVEAHHKFCTNCGSVLRSD